MGSRGSVRMKMSWKQPLNSICLSRTFEAFMYLEFFHNFLGKWPYLNTVHDWNNKECHVGSDFSITVIRALNNFLWNRIFFPHDYWGIETKGKSLKKLVYQLIPHFPGEEQQRAMGRDVETTWDLIDFTADPRDFSWHVSRQKEVFPTKFQSESHPFLFQGEAAPYGANSGFSPF